MKTDGLGPDAQPPDWPRRATHRLSSLRLLPLEVLEIRAIEDHRA